MRKTRIPAGCFQIAAITGTVYSTWNVRCAWLSGFIAFCREGRLAFVVVWIKRRKHDIITWQISHFAFNLKLTFQYRPDTI